MIGFEEVCIFEGSKLFDLGYSTYKSNRAE